MRALTLLLAIGCAESPLPDVLAIETSALPSAIAGVSYRATLAAEGGEGERTWSAKGLPRGLSISTGVIEGTPESEGTFDVEISVADRSGITSRTLPLIVNAGLAITTDTLPRGQVGQPYEFMLSASAEGSWSVVLGSALPPGIALDVEGVLSGTPSEAGTFEFMISVIDARMLSAEKSLSIAIDPISHRPIALPAPSIPTATVGEPFSLAITARDGTGAGYTWTLESGALPPGLTLDSSGARTTHVHGTATDPGSYPATIRVTDANGESASAELLFYVYERLAIVTASLPEGAVGSPYSELLEASGGVGTYRWGFASGLLPDGLAIEGSYVAGTPELSGTFDFDLAVEDEAGHTATAMFTLQVYSDPAIETAFLPDGVVDETYLVSILGSGDRSPIAWSVASGALPPGLSLLSDGTNDAAVFGTPTTLGQYAFELSMIDASGAEARRAFSISIVSLPEITTSSTAIVADLCSTPAIDHSFAVAGGLPPYAWSMSPRATDLALVATGTTARLSGSPRSPRRVRIAVTDARGARDSIGVSIAMENRDLLIDGCLDGDGVRRIYALDLCGAVPGAPVRVSPSQVPGALGPPLISANRDGLISVASAPGVYTLWYGPIDTATIAAPIQISSEAHGTAYSIYESRESRKIIYEAGYASPRLYYVDLTDPANPSLPVAIGPPVGYSGSNLSWLPDDAGVVFTWSVGGVYRAYWVDLSGPTPGPPVDLAPLMTVTANPAGGLITFAIAGDGSGLLFVACDGVLCPLQYVAMSQTGPSPPIACNLSQLEYDTWSFGFSPDGSRIHYVTSERGLGYSELYFRELVNGTPQPATLVAYPVQEGAYYDPIVWTISPERAVIRVGTELFSFDPLTLSSQTLISVGDIAAYQRLALSPDESKIAFTSDIDGDANYEAHVADVEGLAPWSPALVSTSPTFVLDFNWAPDAQALSMITCPEPCQRQRLELSQMSGPNAFAPQIISTPLESVFRQRWLKASRWIAYTGDLLQSEDPIPDYQVDAFWVDLSGPTPSTPARLHVRDLPHPPYEAGPAYQLR